MKRQQNGDHIKRIFSMLDITYYSIESSSPVSIHTIGTCPICGGMFMYYFQKGLAILIGSLFLAVGINVFLAPYEILDGGIIGLSLILHYLFRLKIGLMIIVLSLPIFILAWFKYRNYFYNSLHGLLVSSVAIDLFKPLRFLFKIEALYAAIIGGIIVGLGIGIMLKFETSTGGTDLLAQYISYKTKINVGVIILVIDSFIVLLGGLLLSKDTLFLSIITIFFVGISTSAITGKAIQSTYLNKN